jgi:hypothetical protein
VHVIGHQMPFQDLAVPLPRQFVEQLPQMLPELLIQRPTSAFRDKHYVIVALPSGVT